jgi:type I restriction enzyme S subunit
MNNGLPQGWAACTLGDLFDFKYGKGLPQEKRNEKGLVSVYGSNGVVGVHNAAVTSGPTIVVGRKGSVGEVHLSPEGCWPIDTTYFIDEFPANLPPSYWTLYLKSLRLGQQEKSSAIPGISRDDIYGVEVPLPPLNEQGLIVTKLEKLLAKVDACQQRLAKIPILLKRFRQSVLAAACSGRLSADWLEENPNSNGWKTVGLVELSERIQIGPFGTQLHKADYVSSGVPLINPTHIQSSKIIHDPDFTVSKTKVRELGNYVLQENDIVMGRRGEMARCALVSQNESGWLCGTGSLFVRPKSTVCAAFLFLVLRSPETKAFLEGESKGTTMSNLNLEILKSVPVSISSLPEQQEIVRRVESLFALADQIEARYAKAKAYVQRLTPSLLARAFRGELVPQDPNDEPASVLLERIKRTKTNDQPK